MNPPKDLLTREQGKAPLIFGLLVCCSVSGLLPYLYFSHANWMQWIVLLHAFCGIALSILLLPYLWNHVRRTLGFRRPSLLTSGITTVVLFLLFGVSGWHLLLYGQQESLRWVLHLHIWTGICFATLVLMHMVMHILLLPEKRKQSDRDGLPSLKGNSAKQILMGNVFAALVIITANQVYQQTLEPYQTTPIVEDYLYSYGPHPFRPSQTETFSGQFIDQRQIANSQRCLGCHADIGQQWLASIHKQAASDPAYVTNVSLLATKKGIDATRYCEGCHAPVALLTGQLSPGGEHGGIVNSPGNIEGVACMGCHGIVNLPHLKGVASYTFKPAEDYLFAQSESGILRSLNELLIRIKPDQHRMDMARPLLQDPKFCSSCHTQFMDKDMNNWGWVKMQDEYGAWLDSPFSLQHDRTFSNSEVKRCHDCHMPLEAAKDPSRDVNGLVRSHHFATANTITPLLSGDTKQLERITRFMQGNKMRVSIEEPNRNDATQNQHALDESLRGFGEAPYYYYLGEQATISVVVSNIGVGHDFPGGTIDINQAWLAFTVVDAEDRVIYQSGAVNEQKFVDPNAHFYHSITIDRFGNHVWRHDLFNMVGDSFRRVVPAGGSDVVRYSFDIPGWAKSPLTVTGVLKYRKLNQKYALWALKEKYQPLPIIDMAWDALVIPLRERKEVESLSRK